MKIIRLVVLLTLSAPAFAGSWAPPTAAVARLKFTRSAPSAAVTPVADAEGETVLADYNSNARDVYEKVYAAMAQQGSPTPESECRNSPHRGGQCVVHARLGLFLARVNNLVWGYNQWVMADGEVSCWKDWHERTTAHGTPIGGEWWSYCRFRIGPGSGPRQSW